MTTVWHTGYQFTSGLNDGPFVKDVDLCSQCYMCFLCPAKKKRDSLLADQNDNASIFPRICPLAPFSIPLYMYGQTTEQGFRTSISPDS